MLFLIQVFVNTFVPFDNFKNPLLFVSHYKRACISEKHFTIIYSTGARAMAFHPPTHICHLCPYILITAC